MTPSREAPSQRGLAQQRCDGGSGSAAPFLLLCVVAVCGAIRYNIQCISLRFAMGAEKRKTGRCQKWKNV